MKFEILFNKNIYDSQVKLQFDLVWKDGLKKNKTNLYTGILCFIAGIFIIIGGENAGYVFIVIGLFGLYIFYQYYSNYKQNKDRFFKASEDFAREMENNDDINIWEFDENFFRYKCSKFDYKMDWSLFSNYQVVENNLILSLNDSGYSYILGESEVGAKNFERIVNFLNIKLNNTST